MRRSVESQRVTELEDANTGTPVGGTCAHGRRVRRPELEFERGWGDCVAERGKKRGMALEGGEEVEGFLHILIFYAS